MGGVGSGAKPKKYSPDLVARVRELYEAGHSMAKTAVLTGTTVKVLQVLMPRYGIPRRQAIKRNQHEAANHMWKGDDAGYQAFHLWVQSSRGKPNRCSACDTTSSASRFEWANLTSHYEDINDYIRLCAPCHRRYDTRRPRGGDA